MKITIDNFKITSRFTGMHAALWDDTNFNHHSIFVTNAENQKTTSFSFWGSRMHPEIETEYDLGNAFYCFVEDAIAGMQTFGDFCADFGYDTDSRKAERTWKACKRSAEKLQWIYSGDLYDLANELGELYA